MISDPPGAGPKLTVVVDGQSVLEYDRLKALASRQQQYLDRMDREMDAGFILDGEQVDAPDLLKRAQFVATRLVQALDEESDSIAAATCAYLALRLPDLKQLRVDKKDGLVHIDLVFDEPPASVQTVQFTRPGGRGGLH